MRVLILGLAVGFASPIAFAQRTYSFSLDARLTASGDSNPSVSGLSNIFPSGGDLRTVFGAYPTLQMISEGKNSTFEAFLAYGLNRVNSELDLNSESYNAGVSLSTRLSRNWDLQFSESVTRSPDFSTFSLFRGILFTPEGIFFDYETVALRRNSYANEASLDFDYTLSPTSRISFGVAHSLRDYESGEFFRNRISDQNQFQGNLSYTRTLSRRTNWNLEYRVRQNSFKDFQDARTHEPSFGFSHQLTPTAHFRLEAGPSYIEALGQDQDYLDYHALLSLSKSFEENLLSLSYSHRSGTSTGLGSISDTHRIGVNFSRPLNGWTRLSAAVSVYDTRQRLDNPIETEGVQGTVQVRFLLGENWSLEVGGDYRNQNSSDIFDIDRKRVFATLRFSLPSFWSFRK